MGYDRTISHETISEMVQRIEPTWVVREATPADDGHHVVYHLDIETKTGRRQCVLKATPPEKSPTCDDEARLLAILGARTSLPVPEVLGVVDEHEEVPAPLFISSTLPGANYNRTKLPEFSEATIGRLARSTGRHLAELHGLDAVDAYGFVDVDADETRTGGRPRATVEQIVVRGPVHSWTDYLTAEADRILTRLDATRFGDLCPTVEPVLEARIDDLSGTFTPVVARIDQSLDNVLLDSETGAVTGLLDWEFCVAATPAYDLSFVEHSLAGGHWTLLPGSPDHREVIRSAMLDGYSDASSSRIVEQVHENRECYALLVALHTMLNFDGWLARSGTFDVTAQQREKAAAQLRKRVESVC